jgi:hypothetical protein
VIHAQPAGGEYRVCLRQRDPGKALVGLWTLARLSIVHVGALSQRVGTDHAKVWTGPQILVGNASRDDDYIPTLQR